MAKSYRKLPAGSMGPGALAEKKKEPRKALIKQEAFRGSETLNLLFPLDGGVWLGGKIV